MDFVDYTVQKVTLVLDEIDRLRNSEFPHADAREALDLLRTVFEHDLLRIEKVRSSTNPKTRESACAQASNNIARFLPILGFSLRSTNVRNSFELFIPLLQVSRKLLGGKTKLILSSEWDFSPFTYPQIFSELREFVLIGLPASESGNVLVVPLAGHELGHSVWRAFSLRAFLNPTLEAAVKQALTQNWVALERLYGGKYDVSKIDTDLFIRSIWSPALELSLRQAEETFCDCMGIRIFGESYFHATEYLIGPHFGNRRSMFYPDIQTRMGSMERAAQHFKLSYPSNFSARFSEAPAVLDPQQRFLLELADQASKTTVSSVIAAVEHIANAVSLPLPSSNASDAIFDSFMRGIPANGLKNLADIINAGWKGYFDPSFASGGSSASVRFSYLNELMLKTIEVMEYEIRLEAK